MGLFLFLKVLVLVAVVKAKNTFDDDLYASVLDPELCDLQLRALSNDTLRFRFIDASAKMPSGMLSGNINDMGDYHQCLSIDDYIQTLRIQGKYCALHVPLEQEFINWPSVPDLPDWNITLPVLPPWEVDNETVQQAHMHEKLRQLGLSVAGLKEPVDSRVFPLVMSSMAIMKLSICVPRACSPQQALTFVQQYVPFVNVAFSEFYCRLPNDKPMAAADYVAIVIFSIIVFLTAASTTYDLCHIFLYKRSPADANTLYRSFSLYTNTQRFLTFRSSPGALESMDGVRAISMMWVVVGHTYSMTLIGYIHNPLDIINWMQSFQSTWINAAPITVDTFFLLSGILAVYSVVGKITRRRFLWSIHLFYLNRLLRMFPLLAAVILLQASFFHHVADGPYWNNVAMAVDNCRTYWWSVLLHVQNYVNPLETCLIQTWYLSVDTQLYLVCPLVIFFLFGSSRSAWSVLTGAILLTLVSSSLYSFLYDFTAALANFQRLLELESYIKKYYMNTLSRAPPFVVGLAYGYLLHLYRGKKFHMPVMQSAILWTLSFLMMLFCTLSIYPVMQPTHTAQVFDNFLNAYMRAIWALALGWTIFACVHGYGGPINWFLSLPMWKLPARLSFAMYLIHIPIIYTANGTWVKTHYFTQGESLYRYMSDLLLTVIAALVLCITIDAPFSTLQKLLLGGKKQQPKANLAAESQQNIISDATNSYVIKTSL